MLISGKGRLFNSLSLKKIVRTFIARPTRVVSRLGGYPSVKHEYTREALQKRYERPNFEEEDLEAMKVEAAKQTEKYHYTRESNDKNPLNLIPVRITNSSPISVIPKESTSPLITFVQPRVANKNIAQGIRRKIPVSLKKMRIPVAYACKKHVMDVIGLLDNNPKKGALYMKRALYQVLDHAKQQNLDEYRLYVKSICLGKHRRLKRLRYHAKMKHGMMIRDSSQVHIVLEEKPLEEFFGDMLKGTFPKSFAEILKAKLVAEELDYKMLQKYQPLLTSKGRQQQRLMFKRQVQAKMMELKVFSLVYSGKRHKAEQAFRGGANA